MTRRILAAAASALLLSSCASSPKPQSTDGAALATPAVNLKALETCRGVLRTVPLPGKPGDVADTAFAKEDAALMAANGRIAAGNRCVADVQKRYAGPKGE
jgi:hypothetical protein